MSILEKLRKIKPCEIDPDKFYIITFPKATQQEMKQLQSELNQSNVESIVINKSIKLYEIKPIEEEKK